MSSSYRHDGEVGQLREELRTMHWRCSLSDAIDNESLRHAFNIDLQTAGTLIKAMVAEEVIELIGKSRKFARYRLTKEFQEKIFL